MIKATNSWYVITGAPCSGKTTTLEELKKYGFKVIPEMARVYIDKEMAKGKMLKDIEPNSKKFEEIVLDIKVKKEKQLDPKKIILFDRGIPDTLAYYELYNWDISKDLVETCNRSNYKKVFLFEMLDYKKDYARVESPKDAKKLEDLFYKIYTDAGYNVVKVPPDTIENRTRLVFKKIKEDQNL